MQQGKHKGNWRSYIWILHRYGLTPEKILNRIRIKIGPSIFTVCIPKSGTHLLERALCLHPYLFRKLLPTINPYNINKYGGLPDLLGSLGPNQILLSHLRYSDKYAETINDSGVRCIFMIRDPRDIAISASFYAFNNKKHMWHPLFVSLSDPITRIKLVIQGDPALNYPSIMTTLDRFAGWLDANVLVVRFEDLIGSDGGGDQLKQIETLITIFNYLGLPLNDREIYTLSSHLFSPLSPTFRQGTTGQWRRYFDNTLNNLFHDVAGDLLEKFGYV
jgi:hypothetical protein